MSDAKRILNKWTEEENDIIRNNWEKMSDSELSKLIPNHNTKSISYQRQKLGLLRSPHYDRHTYQDFVDLLATRGYSPISTENEFKSGNTYMKYLCLKHGEKITKLSYILNGRFCPECGKEITSQKMQIEIDYEADKKLCELSGYEYVTTTRGRGKNNVSQILINYICPLHKERGIQKTTRGTMNRGVECCKYCSRRNIPKEELLKEATENSPHIKILNDFEKTNDKVDYICTKHGCKGKTMVSKIIIGQCCVQCGIESSIKKHLLSQDYIENMISENNPDVIFNDTYKGSDKMYSFKCLRCNFVWNERIHKEMYCPNCNGFYKGEQIVNNYLYENNIIFNTQKMFDDCQDKRKLRFDFYLPHRNICIEYQGKQHYEPVSKFGGIEYFELLQKHDQIKRDYCKDNGITLIEIPYTYDTREKIEDFLKDKIV